MTTFVAWLFALPRRFIIGVWDGLVDMYNGFHRYKPAWFMLFTIMSLFSIFFTAPTWGAVGCGASVTSAVLCVAYAAYCMEMKV